MLSVSYVGKNVYSANKTSGVLRGGASGANRGYVLAHRAHRAIQTRVNMIGYNLYDTVWNNIDA